MKIMIGNNLTMITQGNAWVEMAPSKCRAVNKGPASGYALAPTGLTLVQEGESSIRSNLGGDSFSRLGKRCKKQNQIVEMGVSFHNGQGIRIFLRLRNPPGWSGRSGRWIAARSGKRFERVSISWVGRMG